MGTIPANFDAAVAANPNRPMITYYDDATGERTELSGATLANWVAKTANLLLYGYGVSAGDTAAVRVPAHWQTAGILLGCWAAGLSVDTLADPADVAFVGPGQSAEADTVFAVSLHPLGLPMRPAPAPPVLDYAAEVRVHGDHFVPPVPVKPSDLALNGRTHEELLSEAHAWARDRGLTGARDKTPGERILVDLDEYPQEMIWLIAPIAVGASVVLARNLDRDRLADRVAAERVTHAVTAD